MKATKASRTLHSVAVVPVPWHSKDEPAVTASGRVARDLVPVIARQGVEVTLHRPSEAVTVRRGELRALAGAAGTDAVVTVRAWRAEDQLVCAIERFDGRSEAMVFGTGGPWTELAWDAESVRYRIAPDLIRALQG